VELNTFEQFSVKVINIQYTVYSIYFVKNYFFYRNLPATFQEGETIAAKNPGTTGGGEYEKGKTRGCSICCLLPDLPTDQRRQGS
jgi:hypothetical protein